MDRSKPEVAPAELQRIMHAGARHSRFIGRAKTHLHHVLTTAGMNPIAVYNNISPNVYRHV
jgi:hypothetical protein